MSRWLFQLSYGPARLPEYRTARGSVKRIEPPAFSVDHPGRRPAAGCSVYWVSMKLFSNLLRVGCRSLRSALASICRIRSRVT